jgi:hypothetical protein
MKSLTTFLTVTLAATLAAGCNRKKDEHPLTSGKTVEEARKDVGEALEKARVETREAGEARTQLAVAENQLRAKVDELNTRADGRMKELDGKLAGFKQSLAKRTAGLKVDARKDIDDSIRRFDNARAELNQALAELKGSTTATYEDIEHRIEGRLDDMQEAYEDAAGKLD